MCARGGGARKKCSAVSVKLKLLHVCYRFNSTISPMSRNFCGSLKKAANDRFNLYSMTMHLG